MSDNKNFFAKQTDSSRVKATIISEYFPQYCKIISRRHVPRKFGYFDMFAGPGIYDDGSLSTPLFIGKACYEDSFLRDRVWMVFNDMSDEEAIDAAMVQKLLPKIHGSRKKISPVLTALWQLCYKQDAVEIDTLEAMPSVETFKYPLTAEKIWRMYQIAQDNGFTSFAEA